MLDMVRELIKWLSVILHFLLFVKEGSTFPGIVLLKIKEKKHFFIWINVVRC